MRESSGAKAQDLLGALLSGLILRLRSLRLVPNSSGLAQGLRQDRSPDPTRGRPQVRGEEQGVGTGEPQGLKADAWLLDWTAGFPSASSGSALRCEKPRPTRWAVQT